MNHSIPWIPFQFWLSILHHWVNILFLTATNKCSLKERYLILKKVLGYSVKIICFILLLETLETSLPSQSLCVGGFASVDNTIMMGRQWPESHQPEHTVVPSGVCLLKTRYWLLLDSGVQDKNSEPKHRAQWEWNKGGTKVFNSGMRGRIHISNRLLWTNFVCHGTCPGSGCSLRSDSWKGKDKEIAGRGKIMCERDCPPRPLPPASGRLISQKWSKYWTCWLSPSFL